MKWKEVLKEEFKKEYFFKLKEFLEKEYSNKTVFPKRENIFRAFKLTEYDKVKVVILGQDPYHDVNQANGLAFSVNEGVKLPPSLVNIYKEITNEYGGVIPKNGDLESWANQGVLLLNTVLTVRAHMPNSHKNKGWETFTDEVIRKLNDKSKPIVFLLWGNNAKSKKSLIDTNKHYVLESVHPSPLSSHRGFFGCNHFIKVNEILNYLNEGEIKWI